MKGPDSQNKKAKSSSSNAAPETASGEAVATSVPSIETTGDTSASANPVAAASISEAELAELRASAQKAAENWDKYLRTAADLDNYRKRAAREMKEMRAQERMHHIRKLLPVIDALEKGLESAPDKGAAGVFEGMKIIRNMLLGILSDYGTVEIRAVGEAFDPNLHHALAYQASETVPEHHIISEIRKGYMIGDQIVRAADVVVSSGPVPPQTPPGSK